MRFYIRIKWFFRLSNIYLIGYSRSTYSTYNAKNIKQHLLENSILQISWFESTAHLPEYLKKGWDSLVLQSCNVHRNTIYPELNEAGLEKGKVEINFLNSASNKMDKVEKSFAWNIGIYCVYIICIKLCIFGVWIGGNVLRVCMQQLSWSFDTNSGLDKRKMQR